jgi:hypothetical protein
MNGREARESGLWQKAWLHMTDHFSGKLRGSSDPKRKPFAARPG